MRTSVEYTVVFVGHPGNIKGSPFDVQSDFGAVQTIGVSNAFEDAETFREALQKIADGPHEVSARIAQAALDERDAALAANMNAGRS